MGRLVAAIIADDLTGALDSAVPFATMGFHTVTATSLEGLDKALATDAQVVAVSLSSREISADLAQARATDAAMRLTDAPLVLKKIDSRLKGNIAIEVQALIAARQPDALVICPAIPEMGRVVRNGMIEGAGIAQPIKVAGYFDQKCHHIAQFADALTDADLDDLVAAAPAGAIFIGARGLAAALARHFSTGRQSVVLADQVGPVAFVIGSRDPITLTQIVQLQQTTQIDWLAAPDGLVPARMTTGSVIVQAVPGSGQSVDGPTVSTRLAQGFCKYHLTGKRTLVLAGGETAAAVLKAMDIQVLQVLGEAQPGIPVCLPLDNLAGPAIVTKSGGFGDADSLLRLLPKSPLAT